MPVIVIVRISLININGFARPTRLINIDPINSPYKPYISISWQLVICPLYSCWVSIVYSFTAHQLYFRGCQLTMLKPREIEQLIEEMDRETCCWKWVSREQRRCLNLVSRRRGRIDTLNSSVRSQPNHQLLSDMCWLVGPLPLYHPPVQWPEKFCSENCLGPTLGRGIDIGAKSVDTNQIAGWDTFSNDLWSPQFSTKCLGFSLF